jgi:hypothetical protein
MAFEEGSCCLWDGKSFTTSRFPYGILKNDPSIGNAQNFLQEI